MNCDNCFYKNEKCSNCSVSTGKGNNYYFDCFCNQTDFISAEKLIKEKFENIQEQPRESPKEN